MHTSCIEQTNYFVKRP